MTAAQQNGIERPQDELNSFVDEVLVGHPEFAELLISDVVGRDDKLAIVERVIAPRSSEFFANFIRVLIRHGRFGLISLIRSVMVRVQEEAAGQRRYAAFARLAPYLERPCFLSFTPAVSRLPRTTW